MKKRNLKKACVVMLLMLSLGTGCNNKEGEIVNYQGRESFAAAEEYNNIDLDEILKFLESLSGTTYNFFNDMSTTSNEDVFANCISYLVFTKNYTMDGDTYIFNKEDIKTVASKYFMKDNFEYKTYNDNFEYDEANKVFKSKLQFGIYPFIYSEKVERTITNYKVEGNKIVVNYNLKYYDIQEVPGFITDLRPNIDYVITLVRDGEDFKILNVKEDYSSEENKEVTAEKEEIEEFLAPLTTSYNLLDVENDSDEVIFLKSIYYLSLEGGFIYRNADDLYIFEQSNIEDVAKTYFGKKDFKYITTNSNFKYDSNFETVSSKLNFNLYDDEELEGIESKIDNYKIENNIIKVEYSVVSSYTDTKKDKTEKYIITLDKKENSLRILNVEKK